MEASKQISTGWFRTRKIWRVLDETVLPAMQSPTIWCGAAGTGEEPWTAALVAAPHHGRLVATDIHAGNLTTGLHATYPTDAIAEDVPSRYWPQFTQDGGNVSLVPAVRSMVTFGIRNLDTDPAVPCDVAILRNVWRHLSAAGRERLASSLAENLNPDGRLIIGGADLYLVNNLPSTAHELANFLSNPEPATYMDPVRELFEPAEHPFIWRLK